MSRTSAAPAPAPAADGSPPASPCTNVCRMDPESGWCLGCCRTIEEIAAWSRLDDGGKRAVLAELPARRSARAAARSG